jgi:hypothetical protein
VFNIIGVENSAGRIDIGRALECARRRVPSLGDSLRD